MRKTRIAREPGHELGYETDHGNPAFKLVFAHETNARPAEAFERDDWAYWNFEAVLSGAGTLRVQDQLYHVGAGDLFVLPKGRSHWYSADPIRPWVKLYIVIRGTLIPHLLSAYQLGRRVHFRSVNVEPVMRSIASLRQAPASNIHDQAALLFHQLVLALTADAHQDRTSLTPRIQAVVDLIHRNLESSLSIKEMTTYAGLSSSRLTRLFKKEVGVTPYAYLIRQKMVRAEHFLQFTNRSVRAIAEQLGYVDAYYFSNAFKKHSGIAPSAYRLDSSNSSE